MQTLLGIAVLIAIGWVVLALLPVILPLAGFLIAGIVAVWILAAVFGK
jgi:hypothetical protein